MLERLDQPLSVDEAQARKLSDATHGIYELSSCQQVVNFGPAPLVQEGDQLFTSTTVGFLLGRERYSD